MFAKVQAMMGEDEELADEDMNELFAPAAAAADSEKLTGLKQLFNPTRVASDKKCEVHRWCAARVVIESPLLRHIVLPTCE